MGIAWAIHKWDCTGLADSLSWRSVLCAIACILAAAVWLGGERAQMLLMASAFPVMLAFFKLGAILATHRPTFGVLKTLGPQAFFLYCAHGPSLDFLLRWQLMPFFDRSSQAGLTASILVHTILLVCTCTVAGKCMERWYPRAYALLTGGRVAPPKGYIQR